MDSSLTTEAHVAGSFQFAKEVTLTTLEDILRTWKAEMPNQWVDLHVRKMGDNECHYISFHYILKDGKKRTYDKFCHRLIQTLKGRFGIHRSEEGKYVPNHVTRWSISSVDAIG